MAPKLSLIYRLLFFYLEPIGALNGARLLLFLPNDYLGYVFPGPIPSKPDASVMPVFDQLAGAWALFAFNEAVVLRCTSDVRVWKLMCLGMLLTTDALSVVSVYRALGPATFLPQTWRAADWGVVLATVVPLVARLCLVTGLGISPEMADGAKKHA